MPKRLGYFRKNKSSNKRLISLFEHNQNLRFTSSDADWENKTFVRNLNTSEKKARKEISRMLKAGKLKTAEDFYRAAFMFQHGENQNDYSMAVTLAVSSMLLGEPWAKSFFAKTIDRFLLSVSRPQIFYTQYELRKGKWALSNYEKKLSGKVRKMFDAGSLRDAIKGETDLNQAG